MSREFKENGKAYQPIAGNKNWEVMVLRNDFGSARKPVEVTVHELRMPDPRARLAVACIEKWAMLAAEVDGEDSSGRAKLRRMTPAELVGHACDVADKAYSEFEQRGWLIEVPSYASLVDSVKDREDTND